MERNTPKIVFYIIPLLLLGCDSTTDGGRWFSSQVKNNSAIQMEVSDYISWCRDKDNGLLKSKVIKNMCYTLQYKPLEYIACVENEGNISKEELKSKEAELSGLDYYDLRIEAPENVGELLKYKLNSSAEYQQRVNYFAFSMQNDIKMICGGDTLDCKLYHFERAYDIAPYATFLLAFPKSSCAEKTFVFQDKVFGTGIIKFTYLSSETNLLPQLALK